jgi:hypothetical protein
MMSLRAGRVRALINSRQVHAFTHICNKFFTHFLLCRATIRVQRLRADQAIFAHSDVLHEHVMHVASRVLAAGADFGLMGAQATMLKSDKPVVVVCAGRIGSGHSLLGRREQ